MRASNKFGKAKNTTKAYQLYVVNGKKWLTELVEAERKRGMDHMGQVPLDKLAVAFENPPNQYSAVALELFITHKCIEQDCGKSTAEGIHGAFCQYWDKMEDQVYAGAYVFDKSSGVVQGCPARAPVVQDIVKAIKTRALAKGASATRQHTKAITIGDMRTMMHWSETVCPSQWFDIPGPFLTGVDLETIQKMNEHGLMHAFSTTGFTLFTRNFETASLQVSDMEFNCHSPPPDYIPHFKVTLEERKGWQKQVGYEGPRSANTYEIYQQKECAIDMYKHLLRWLIYLEKRLGRPLEATDYIFPHIAVNGTIDPKRPISYDAVQGLLSDFTRNAGLTKVYTTHCFRRGGAQYRFMFAPIGERWSLLIIRWWGGWAMGEHVDTLIKYLVDSLQSYEAGHADALCLIKKEADKSFLGEHMMLQPATREDNQQVKYLIAHTGQRIEQSMGQVQTYLQGVLDIASWSSVYAHTVNAMPYAVSPSNFQNRTLNPLPANALVDTYDVPLSDSTLITEAINDEPKNRKCGLASSKAPIPGVVIPNLKTGPTAWKDAIAQWEVGGEGLPMPLKDWPKEWFQGDMRKITGSKRGHREMIYKEYIRLGRDDNAFVAEYPKAEKSARQLLQAIRRQVDCPRHRRQSKNGTPSQRDMKVL